FSSLCLHDALPILVAAGGETQTATLFLPAGDYQVRLAHVGGAGTLTASLAVAALSNPLGPSASDAARVPQPLPPGAAALGYWWELGLPGFVAGPTANGPTPGGTTPGGETPGRAAGARGGPHP